MTSYILHKKCNFLFLLNLYKEIYHLVFTEDNTKNIAEFQMTNLKADVWDRISNHGIRLEPEDGQQVGCLMWPFVAAKGKYKYGVTRVVGKGKQRVHRVSFWIHSNYVSIDDIPRKNINGDNVMVCHKCNNSLCFEPSHLQIDTELNNNNRDKLENGTLLVGEKNHQATITQELALKIKHSYYPIGHEQYMTKEKRAQLFEVSKRIVRSIDEGAAWAHLPDLDGNVVGTAKQNDERRQKRIEARNAVWTEEMFKEAYQKLLNSSTLTYTILTPFVDTPCRIWNKGYDRDGYGIINIFGKEMKTHVLACEYKNNMHKPEGMVTRHLCGNRSCCNKDHLEFGTYRENGIDTVIHGNCNNKFTDDQVREIRKNTENLSYSALGKKYDVNGETIGRIMKGISYTHVK